MGEAPDVVGQGGDGGTDEPARGHEDECFSASDLGRLVSAVAGQQPADHEPDTERDLERGVADLEVAAPVLQHDGQLLGVPRLEIGAEPDPGVVTVTTAAAGRSFVAEGLQLALVTAADIMRMAKVRRCDA